VSDRHAALNRTKRTVCQTDRQTCSSEQDQTHSVSDRQTCSSEQDQTHSVSRQTYTSEQDQMHSVSDRLAPRRCLKTLNCTVGEWFCPRCRSELELDSSNEPMHSSLVPSRLMNQEDCYRSLAAALGMPPAQSDCCDMFRPVCHLESQSAVHNDCTALSYANCTSTVSNCISCAVLYCTVLYCTVLYFYCYCTVLQRSLIPVAPMLHVVGPPMGW